MKPERKLYAGVLVLVLALCLLVMSVVDPAAAEAFMAPTALVATAVVVGEVIDGHTGRLGRRR